jgi:hypothetical protein
MQKDFRSIHRFYSSYIKWSESDWNLRAVEAGLTDMAVIMSDNLFTQLSLQGFARAVKGKYTVEVFNSESEARKWLECQTTLSN